MQRENEVQQVFLVGAKSLGAYGGYETFVYKLTEYHQNKKNIKYHVACKANGDGCMDEIKVVHITFAGHFYKEIHKLGGTVYLNPDGAAVIIGTLFEENSQAKSAKLEVAA